jgi:Uma2 family endonuclease
MLLKHIKKPPNEEKVRPVVTGELQHERDYIAKRRQYEELGIPEYWLVDPERKIVTIFSLSNQTYRESAALQGKAFIVSPTFPQLQFNAGQE